MADTNLPTGRANIYYSSENNDPDAVVILNRGTEYELDITNDIISFNTSNSIDSSTGSFTVTLDNKNDHLVNRFNYSRIKKMSSIEIFAQPLNSYGGRESKFSSNSQSVQIPEEIDGKKPTINSMFNFVYGSSIGAESKKYLKSQFDALNANRVVPQLSGQIDKLRLRAQGVGVAIFNNAGTKADPTLQTDCQIKFIALTQSESAKKLVENATPIKIGPQDRVFFQDEFYLKFTMVKTELNTQFQEYISVNQSEQNVPLPANEDEEFSDAQRAAPLKFAQPKGMYQRIFFGVVVNISVQVTPGSGLSVVINGEGIGYWLRVSYINVKPGGFEANFAGVDLQAFSTKFTELKALDVFRRLLSASMDIPTVTNFNVGITDTAYESLVLAGSASDMKTANGEVAKQKDYEGKDTGEKVTLKGTLPTQRLNDLNAREELIWEGVSIYGSAADVTKKWSDYAKQYRQNTSDQKSLLAKQTSNLNKQKQLASNDVVGKEKLSEEFSQYSKTSETLKKKRAELRSLSGMGGLPEVQNQLQAVAVTRNTISAEISQSMSKGRKAYLKQVGIMDHWKSIFSNLILEVLDDDVFLENVYPYSYIMSGPTASLDGDYVSKETIARQIVELLQYEFYFDTNGHFVLKPPFFNMSYDQSYDMYTIKDDQVVSFSCNDTVDGLVNRISVTGDFRTAPGSDPLLTQNIFQDMRLIRDFGFHPKQVGQLNYLHNSADCRDFGISMMSRNNMNLFNASVTIQGRPGIRLGTPVYFMPRDTIYYIKDISHEFSVGGQYTTTLGLIGGRRIVTGFKSNKKIQTFKRSTVNELNTNKPGESVKVTAFTGISSSEIEHYILSDGFNTESIAEYNAAAGIRNTQQEAAADGDSLVGLNSGQTDKVFVLRNKYLIVDHYNTAYIGLIVDQNSGPISNINLANFEYFNKLSVSSIPNNDLFGQLEPADKEGVVAYIKEKFELFKTGAGSDGTPGPESEFITDGNASKTFTIGERKNWITFFLVASGHDIAGESYDANGVITGINPESTGSAFQSRKLTIGRAANIFNLLVANIDKNGLYKQFTDQAGRELQAYQDYGLSLIYENNLAKLNNISVADESLANNKRNVGSKKNNKDKVSAGNAKNLSGVYSPNSDSFKRFLEDKFSNYKNRLEGTGVAPAPITSLAPSANPQTSGSDELPALNINTKK